MLSFRAWLQRHTCVFEAVSERQVIVVEPPDLLAPPTLL